MGIMRKFGQSGSFASSASPDAARPIPVAPPVNLPPKSNLPSSRSSKRSLRMAWYSKGWFLAPVRY